MTRNLTQEELELQINENIKIINKESCALRPDLKALRNAQRELSVLAREFNRRGYGIMVIKWFQQKI